MSVDRSEGKALDAVLDEARSSYVPRDVRWDDVARGIDARLAENEGRRAPAAPGPSRLHLYVGAIAVAAAVSLVVAQRTPATSSGPGSVAQEPHRPAPSFVLRGAWGGDTQADVRVSGAVAPVGYTIRAGDLVEVRAARAVFEQSKRAVWLFEPGTRGRVATAGDVLVLGLESGALEAQVAPSALPESFAVDVVQGTDVVRIAVHGTHLRVAREGTHVVVDLSEGVVSIGRPPRVGVTHGTTVTAPAHVELDVVRLESTLRVDRGLEAVRAPVALEASDDPSAPSTPGTPGTPGDEKPSSPATVPPPSADTRAPSPPPAAPAARRRPTSELAEAVRGCARTTEKPGSARVSVSSLLHVNVSADGTVTSARFDPPLSPALQGCAAAAIYRMRLDTKGDVSVPILFDY